jgi:hypothetical protein
MAKLWLVICAAGLTTGCTTAAPGIADGTYALSISGDTCKQSSWTAITFANDMLVGQPSAVIDGTTVTFDSNSSYRNTDSGDWNEAQEHFVLSVGEYTLSGTLDASYAGMFYQQMWSCMPTLTVTGTRT